MYCLPVLKHERHRQALLRAVASGSPKFFLGTDSAPHAKTAKETACGAHSLPAALLLSPPACSHTPQANNRSISDAINTPYTPPHRTAGCAGCFSAFAGVELYAEVFETLGVLDKLEAFTSHNGARFYGLPLNAEKVTLVRRPWRVPDSFPLGGGAVVVPLKAGEELAWTIKE